MKNVAINPEEVMFVDKKKIFSSLKSQLYKFVKCSH